MIRQKDALAKLARTLRPQPNDDNSIPGGVLAIAIVSLADDTRPDDGALGFEAHFETLSPPFERLNLADTIKQRLVLIDIISTMHEAVCVALAEQKHLLAEDKAKVAPEPDGVH